MSHEEIDGVPVWYEEHVAPARSPLVVLQGGIITFQGCPQVRVRLGMTICWFMWRKQRLAFDSSAPKEWTTREFASARLYRRLLAAVQAADESVALVQKDRVATDQL